MGSEGNCPSRSASPAQWEHDIGLLTIAITTGIFIVVASIIVYTIFRFRRKPSDDMHQEPAQVFGSNQIVDVSQAVDWDVAQNVGRVNDAAGRNRLVKRMRGGDLVRRFGDRLERAL